MYTLIHTDPGIISVKCFYWHPLIPLPVKVKYYISILCLMLNALRCSSHSHLTHTHMLLLCYPSLLLPSSDLLTSLTQITIFSRIFIFHQLGLGISFHNNFSPTPSVSVLNNLLSLAPTSLFQQGVMESFLGTALAGSVFCLFSGQPLIILSSTGPILIFEKLLFEFSKWASLDDPAIDLCSENTLESVDTLFNVN